MGAATRPTDRTTTMATTTTAGWKTPPPPGSLRRLSRAIDERLHFIDAKQKEGKLIAAGGRARLSSPIFGEGPPAVPDNSPISSLLFYNHIYGDWSNQVSSSTYNVAVVFGKTLVRDQITVEYASRIRTLARLFKEEPLFRPSLVCFCGPVGGGNHVSDADAGLIFFRHMCEAQGIGLDEVSIHVDSGSADAEEALRRVADEVRGRYLPRWIEVSPVEVEVGDEGGPGIGPGGDPSFGTGDRALTRMKVKRVAVHFSLVSTEYHLCNLNDVHHRSPRQSHLTPLEGLRRTAGDVRQAAGLFGGGLNRFAGAGAAAGFPPPVDPGRIDLDRGGHTINSRYGSGPQSARGGWRRGYDDDYDDEDEDDGEEDYAAKPPDRRGG